MLNLDLYVYLCKKWERIEETLMKLNLCRFLIKDDELLEKYKFDSKPVYKEKYLKAKKKNL